MPVDVSTRSKWFGLITSIIGKGTSLRHYDRAHFAPLYHVREVSFIRSLFLRKSESGPDGEVH